MQRQEGEPVGNNELLQDPEDDHESDEEANDDTNDGANVNPNVTAITRSGRHIRPPARYRHYVAYSVDQIPSSEGEEHEHLVAYAASSDPDVMYLQEAMAAPDREQFLLAMEQEVRSHVENKNWIVVDRASVPHGHKVL
jgi:hypothetical protein